MPPHAQDCEQSIENEGGLTYKEQVTARRPLRERGLIRERAARLEHRIYFKLNILRFKQAW